MARMIQSTKFCGEGHVFVVDSNGLVLIHHDASKVGKKIVEDLKQTEFLEVLKNGVGKGAFKTVSYSGAGGKRAFVTYTRIPDWDCYICAAGSWDDMSKDAVSNAKTLLEEDLLKKQKLATKEFDGKTFHVYNQVRFLLTDGAEVVVAKDGALASNLGSRKGIQWFEDTLKLKDGDSLTTAVEVALNTQAAECRIGTPVYWAGVLSGVVVVNVNWDVIWQLLKNRTYGKTGYPYIINDKGVLISHPKYTLKDNKNISLDSFGEQLAKIVREHMLKGEADAGRYTFENIDKYVVYRPLKIGGHLYSLAATCPVSEVMVGKEVEERASSNISRFAIMIAVSLLCLLLISSFVGLLFGRRVVKPVREMLLLTESISDGDLTRRVEAMSNDEIGRMSRAMNETCEQLVRAMSEIRAASDQTAASGEELSATAQSISTGSQQQASEVGQISSSVQKLVESIQTVADKANDASGVADETKRSARRGGDTVRKSIEGMKLINESSEKISKIIGVISQIASQTNLLALNAAIEAASAGEHGLGFAVVADEVRKLAERSSQATEEITQLIKESTSRVDEGSKLSDEVGKALSEIVDGIEKTGSAMALIRSSTSEQAGTASEVAKGMESISSVTESNSASAEEMSASAEELAAQAQKLQELVSKFKIDSDGHTASGVGQVGVRVSGAGTKRLVIEGKQAPAAVGAAAARKALPRS